MKKDLKGLIIAIGVLAFFIIFILIDGFISSIYNPRPTLNSKIKNSVKNIITAQNAHLEDHKRYADSFDKLRDIGFVPDCSGLIIYVIIADETQYKMLVFHEESDNGFLLKGLRGSPKKNYEAIAEIPKSEIVAMIEKDSADKWPKKKIHIPDPKN